MGTKYNRVYLAYELVLGLFATRFVPCFPFFVWQRVQPLLPISQLQFWPMGGTVRRWVRFCSYVVFALWLQLLQNRLAVVLASSMTLALGTGNTTSSFCGNVVTTYCANLWVTSLFALGFSTLPALVYMRPCVKFPLS